MTQENSKENAGRLVATAKVACRKCYGRGFTGTLQDGKKLWCSCIRFIKKEESDESVEGQTEASEEHVL